MKNTKSSAASQGGPQQHDGSDSAANATPPNDSKADSKPDSKAAAKTSIDDIIETVSRDEPAADADPATNAEMKIAQLESEKAEYRDRFIRSQAELQNVQRRAEREIAQVRSYANERFARELLAIKDSLEMGLQSDIAKDAARLHEGLELTLKLLVQIFDNFDIQEINPHGELFNPELHQAMMTRADAQQPPHTVLEVLQKGYTMNGRLLRAAMVCVCSAPPPSTVSASAESAPSPADDAAAGVQKEQPAAAQPADHAENKGNDSD